LRRVPEDERKGVEEINDKQNSVKKYFSAARTANKYKQQASIDEPTLRGRTPRSEASIDGVELPSLGDTYRASGTVGYAKKPQPQSGRFTGFD
jgi:hypothetical protein